MKISFLHTFIQMQILLSNSEMAYFIIFVTASKKKSLKTDRDFKEVTDSKT